MTVFSTRAPAPVRLALLDVKPRVGNVAVGFFASTEDVRTCADAVQAVVTRLDNDISVFFAKRWSDPAKADEPVPPAEKDYLDRWKRFFAEFETWKSVDVDDCALKLHPLACLPGPLYDQCSGWNERHDEWYDSFVSDFGGKPSGPKNAHVNPDTGAPCGGKGQPACPSSIDWGTYLFWGLVVGGVVAVGYFLGNLRRLAP